jgi:hypothetical protein
MPDVLPVLPVTLPVLPVICPVVVPGLQTPNSWPFSPNLQSAVQKVV